MSLTKRKVFVRNLPYTCNDEQLVELFSNDGPVKDVFVVKDPDNKEKCKGYGFVTFALEEDAVKALHGVKWLDGRKIQVNPANQKGERGTPRGKTPTKRVTKENGDAVSEKTGGKESSDKETDEEDEQEEQTVQGQKRKPDKSSDGDVDTKPWKKIKSSSAHYYDPECALQMHVSIRQKQEELKPFFEQFGTVKNTKLVKFQQKYDERVTAKAFINFASKEAADECFKQSNDEQNPLVLNGWKLLIKRALPPNKDRQLTTDGRESQATVMIRNISFQCTQGELRDMFSQFGKIVDLRLPLRFGNEKLKTKFSHKGFAFLDYETKDEAQAAIGAMNGHEIHGRPIAVDFSLPRDEYWKAKQQTSEKLNNETKKSEDLKDNAAGKDDDDEGSNDDGSDDDDGESDDDSKSDEDVDDEDGDKPDDDEEEDEESDEDMESDERQKKVSHDSKDVEEGKTIFVRNLPFEVTEVEISNLFKRFGAIQICSLVKDQMTGQSRGSAFVKFVKNESAETCVKKSSEFNNSLQLHGRHLIVLAAVSRDKAGELQEKRKKIERMEEKDRRNLYLLREGFIRPGTQAATGLSPADIAKRAKVEAVKRAKMKNIYIFVSKTRLVVHNLPQQVDDKKLKEVFMSAVKAKAGVRVTEAKVMRDQSILGEDKMGKSLGYGFVSYSEHNHALEALRTVNDNPEYFGKDKKLIVGFSLENRRALEKKERQIEKNKMKHAQEKKRPEKKKAEKVDINLETDPRVNIPANMKKGVLKHPHAKLRWRDRGKRDAEARHVKLSKRKKLFLQQAGKKMSQGVMVKVPEDAPGVRVKKPSSKGKRVSWDKKEDQKFESLVKQYKNDLTQSMEDNDKKWYE